MLRRSVFAAALLGAALLLPACATQAAATSTPVSEGTQAPEPTVPPTQTAAPSPTADTIPGVSFSTDIRPLLTGRCGSCHGGQRTEEGLDLFSYPSVMAGSDAGPVVIPGDAAHSKLARVVAEGEMPKRGPKLTPAQVQLIIDWINAGALNN
jgi:hypothetical protein